MRNHYLEAEKKFDRQKAGGYVAFQEIMTKFNSVKCASSFALENLYLHYSAMPEGKKMEAEDRAEKAVALCSIPDMSDLHAEVKIKKGDKKSDLQIRFCTYCDRGDIVAEVDSLGNIKIRRAE